MPLQFDPKTARWKLPSGQFATREQVRAAAEESLEDSKAAIADLSDRLAADEISVGDWESGMAAELKTLHLQGYLLGRGGRNAAISEEEWGPLEAGLRDQYGHLKNFGDDLAEGKVSPAMLAARAAMYGGSLLGAHSLGERQANRAAGSRWERRHTAMAPPVCDDCVHWAGLGWQPLGTLPPIGYDCVCKSNCRCQFEYSDAKARPQDILRARFGWIVGAD